MFRNHRVYALAFVSAALLLPFGAGAQGVLPGSPLSLPGQPAPPVKQVNVMSQRIYAPKLDLLLTLRTLHDLRRAGTLEKVLTATQAQALATVLRELSAASRLDDVGASAFQADLHRALGTRGQAQVLDARTRLERRAQMELASSRLARDGSPFSLTEWRLSFIVPGGQGVLLALQRDAGLNPFRQGVPAATLQELLNVLSRRPS